MNPTEKLEMQVAEEQDGSAVVQLPDGVESPQVEDGEEGGERKSEFRTDDDGYDDDSEGSRSEDPEREQIRAARREERKLKKQLHREKARESNHLINALKKQNQELADRLARVEQKTAGADLARVDKAIEDAGVQIEYARMKMQEAASSNDGVSLTRAEEMLYEARRNLESLQSMKTQATRQMSQPNQTIQAPDPITQRLAADWMEDNPWYDPKGGNEESQIAQVIDKKLTQEGFDPSTDDYWDELTDRLKKYIPQKTNRGYNENNIRNQRPRSVVTSSGRESSASLRKGDYVLSPDRVAALKEAGVWDNPEAKKRYIQRFVEWDRQNKGRN